MGWIAGAVYALLIIAGFLLACFVLVLLSESAKRRSEAWKARYEQRDKDYAELLAAHRAILESRTSTT